MQFADVLEGDYRIYAGAVEALTYGGYHAAVIVSRTAGVLDKPREAFRDTQLAAGYRWDTSAEALTFAIHRGQEIVRNRPSMLTC